MHYVKKTAYYLLKLLISTILVSTWLRTVQCLELSKSACQKSLDTIAHVSRCPRNKEEYETEAKRKNCSQYNNDECPALLYHCVWNDNTTGLVEVCAALRYVSDSRCALFSTTLLTIRDNYVRNCSYLTPPCSRYYESTETYKYAGCYTMDDNPKPVAEKSVYPEQEVFPTWAIVLLILASICVIVAIAYTMYRCRRKELENRSKPQNTQDGSADVMVDDTDKV